MFYSNTDNELDFAYYSTASKAWHTPTVDRRLKIKPGSSFMSFELAAPNFPSQISTVAKSYGACAIVYQSPDKNVLLYNAVTVKDAANTYTLSHATDASYEIPLFQGGKGDYEPLSLTSIVTLPYRTASLEVNKISSNGVDRIYYQTKSGKIVGSGFDTATTDLTKMALIDGTYHLPP